VDVKNNRKIHPTPKNYNEPSEKPTFVTSFDISGCRTRGTRGAGVDRKRSGGRDRRRA
jgi:hypothetical protein